MYILLFFLLLLATFVYALFDIYSVIAFQLDTDRNDVHLTIRWLYPFFMAKIAMINYSPHLDMFLFNIRIYSKAVKAKTQQKQNPADMMRKLELKDAYANIYYGLDNPFTAGIACGILGYLSASLKNIALTQFPVFVPEHEYIVIQAGSKLNIGKTSVRFIQDWYAKNKIKRSDQYGSVQYG